MEIDDLEAIPIAIDRNEVFKISTGSSLTAENVIIKVESDDARGWGNSSVNGVTGETLESILKAFETMKSKIVGEDVVIEEVWADMRKNLPDDPAALAGLDIALFDVKGKLEGRTITEMFGGKREGIMTDRTIGHMTKRETVKHARKFIDEGFKALKIKVGLGLMEDINRVKAVREEVGEDIDIWIDANQAFTPEESITLCQKLADCIEFVEQPVKVHDIEGLKKVTEETEIPIMADETIKGPEMAKKICEEGIADMINIKLAKCGGLTGGRKIVEIMEDHGVEGMVGCMGETSVSISAGAHLFNSTDNLKYADLDSHFMLSDNIATGLDFVEGSLWTSKRPGTGIQIDKEKLDKYRVKIEGER